MSWHAFDVIEEAYGRTIGLLFKPFNWRLYLKLAFIVFLTSGSGFNQGSNYVSDGGDFPSSFHSTTAYIIVGALVLGILFFVIIFGVVSGVFEFIFIDAVLTKRVEIAARFKKRFWFGVRLFAFQVALIILLALVFGIGAAIAVMVGLGGMAPVAKIALIVFGVLIGLLILIAFIVAAAFTTDFVAPLMRAKNTGVLAGWRTLLPEIKANKAQFGLYVLLKIFLGIVAGIISFIAAILVLLVFAIVFGIPAAILAVIFYSIGVSFSGLTSLGIMLVPFIVLVVLLVIAFSIFFAYVITVVTLPIPVFFRYYSILFLDKVTPNHNVLGGGRARETPERVEREKPDEREAKPGKKETKPDEKDAKPGEKSTGYGESGQPDLFID